MSAKGLPRPAAGQSPPSKSRSKSRNARRMNARGSKRVSSVFVNIAHLLSFIMGAADASSDCRNGSRRFPATPRARTPLIEHEQSVLNAQHACSHELPQRSLTTHAVVVEQPHRLRECQVQPGYL